MGFAAGATGRCGCWRCRRSPNFPKDAGGVLTSAWACGTLQVFAVLPARILPRELKRLHFEVRPPAKKPRRPQGLRDFLSSRFAKFSSSGRKDVAFFSQRINRKEIVRLYSRAAKFSSNPSISTGLGQEKPRWKHRGFLVLFSRADKTPTARVRGYHQAASTTGRTKVVSSSLREAPMRVLTIWRYLESTMRSF